MAEIDILVPGPLSEVLIDQLADFRLHEIWREDDPERALGRISDTVRGIARGVTAPVGAALLDRLPQLEIVASFGVGYDAVDAAHAARLGVIVTNTPPDILTEEVADVTLALLIMTLRELSASERYLRAGQWADEGFYRSSPGTLRDRTVGIVGLGRIGTAIARRLDASLVPVVYHNRRERTDVPYRYYADLVEMAAAVDTLVVVTPGGAGTDKLIDAAVIEALGPRGVIVNVGRGSAVDEDALIEALTAGRLMGAGLDVYRREPDFDQRLLAFDNVVLLPHVGGSSVPTRMAMDQIVADNLKSWFFKGEPLTPVPETPWPRRPLGESESAA